MPDTEAAVERIMAVPGRCNCGPSRVEFANHGCDDLRDAIREELAAAQREGYVRALEAVGRCTEPPCGEVRGGRYTITGFQCTVHRLLAEAREAT